MNKLFKLTLGVLAIASMQACSDTNDQPAPPTADTDETRYLRVSIASNNETGTRALGSSDFDAGTAAESAVNSLDFYFYDRNQNYVSHVRMDASDNKFQTGDVTSPDHVNKVITSIVPIELVQGATIPNYVIVAVNAVDPASHMNKSLSEAQKDILSSVRESNGTKSGFAMSNSVYYDNDVVSNQNNVLIMATPFESNVLKTKSEMDKIVAAGTAAGATSEAIQALNDITIDCYVERYAVKVKLSGTQNTTSGEGESAVTTNSIKVDDYVTNGITLTFVPEGWTINNYEKNCYFIKSFRSSASATDFRTLDNVNAALPWDWNDATRYRSYWTATPAYYSQSYPVVADDILDVLGSTKYDPNTKMTNYPYNTFYQSYNHFKSANGATKIGEVNYFNESTVTKNVLTGEGMPSQHNPLAAIASAIVAGYYEVYVGGTKVQTADNKTPTFYTYGTNGSGAAERATIWTAETDKGGAAITGAKSLRDYFLKEQKVIYFLDNAGNKVYDLTDVSSAPAADAAALANLTAEFSIEHPAKASREGLKIASRIVTLQHKTNTTNAKLFFHDPLAATGAQEVALNSEANIARANRLLYETLGGASAFNEGRAFFSAPIHHYGWYRNSSNTINTGNQKTNPNYGKTQREWDWTKMEAGDFGLVRNHSYSLEVNQISGLGTGILGFDDPLLPPSDNVTYNMRFHILIQKWAVVRKQSIDW